MLEDEAGMLVSTGVHTQSLSNCNRFGMIRVELRTAADKRVAISPKYCEMLPVLGPNGDDPHDYKHAYTKTRMWLLL